MIEMKEKLSKSIKQKVQTKRQEATGIRFVRMIFEEYFGWGYVENPQHNDDGIDGIVFVRDRKGDDTGARISVQVKSGPGYLHECKNGVLSINAYSKVEFDKHQQIYDSLDHPVILVYVNSLKKDSQGREFWDLRNPKAWWVLLNKYCNDDGTSVYRIDPKNTFGEHSKGDMQHLVGDSNRVWLRYGIYVMSPSNLKLWRSLSLREDARKIYNTWKCNHPSITWKSEIDGRTKTVPLIVSKKGWRHINNGRRGRDRIFTSLRLISTVVEILSSPIPLFMFREGYKGVNASEYFYAVRKRVYVDEKDVKVQIILRRWVNESKHIDKWWFYSVHTIKD